MIVATADDFNILTNKRAGVKRTSSKRRFCVTGHPIRGQKPQLGAVPNFSLRTRSQDQGIYGSGNSGSFSELGWTGVSELYRSQ